MGLIGSAPSTYTTYLLSTTDTLGNTWRNLLVLVSSPSSLAKPAIQVHPNPATNQIVLKGLPEGHHTLTITDVLGKLMNSNQVSNAEIIPLDLASGLYFYQVLGQKGRLMVR